MKETGGLEVVGTYLVQRRTANRKQVVIAQPWLRLHVEGRHQSTTEMARWGSTLVNARDKRSRLALGPKKKGNGKSRSSSGRQRRRQEGRHPFHPQARNSSVQEQDKRRGTATRHSRKAPAY